MRTISALFATLTFGFALTAQANPKVLMCADDRGDGGVQDIQTKLKASMAFASVDVVDCSANTPTLADLKMYHAALVFTAIGLADQNSLGDNLADYVDA